MRTLRAISPVVATTLLIIIAVVTAVVLYLWVSGTVGQQPTQQTKLQEAIKIDAVKVDTANGEVVAYVRNVGNVKAVVTAIYVINATSNTMICQDTSKSVELAPGEAKEVSVTCNSLSGVKSAILLVKVVTKDGVEATYLTSYTS